MTNEEVYAVLVELYKIDKTLGSLTVKNVQGVVFISHILTRHNDTIWSMQPEKPSVEVTRDLIIGLLNDLNVGDTVGIIGQIEADILPIGRRFEKVGDNDWKETTVPRPPMPRTPRSE